MAFATAVPCQRHVLRKVKTEEEGESMDERERKELRIIQLRPLSINTSSISYQGFGYYALDFDSEKFGRLPFPHSTHNLIFTKAQNDNAGFKIIHDSSTRCHTVIGHGMDYST